MDWTTEEWVAVIGLAVPAIGWVTTSMLQSARDVRQARIKAVADHTAKQLEQLYGPLLTLLIEGEQAWHACLRSFGQDPSDPSLFPPPYRTDTVRAGCFGATG